MRKRTIEVGVVVLFAGIAVMILAGVAISETAVLSSHYSLHTRGEYVSDEISVAGTGRIAVFGNGTIGTLGLVSSAELNSVTVSNITSIAITPSTAAGGLQLYTVSTGSYYFVIFGDSPPEYVYASFHAALFEELAASVISGFVLFLSGVAIAVIGTFQNERR
ncbi:MAG: hypothetical protein ACYCT2_04560 [Thermoplasmataceae archaeon]